MKFILLFSFTLLPFSSAISETITDDFARDRFMKNFFINPNYDELKEFMQYSIKSDVTPNKVSMPILSFLLCAAKSGGEDKIKHLIEYASSLPSPANSVYGKGLLADIEQFVSGRPDSVGKNDMLWACFYATGEERYLTKLLNLAKMSKDRVDITNFMIGASAEWSLSANANESPHVRDFLKKVSESKDDIKLAELASKILKSDPTKLKAAITEVLRDQKDKGIWKEY